MLDSPLSVILRANEFDKFYAEYSDRFSQDVVACREFFDHLRKRVLRMDGDNFFNVIDECGRNLYTKTPEDAKRIFDEAASEIDRNSQLRLIPEGVLDKLTISLKNNDHTAARSVIAPHRSELRPDQQLRMIGYQMAGVSNDSGRRAAAGRLLDRGQSWDRPRDINLL